MSLHGRGLWLCLGLDAESVLRQAITALATGNMVLAVRTEAIDALLSGLPCGDSFTWNGELDDVLSLPDLAGVALSADLRTLGNARRLLAARDGPLVQLVAGHPDPARFVTERTLSIDITAAGGNVGLLAADEP